ncbi:MAG TPA: CocE/NonD family hydrolase [Terracidiphilus sp.]|nr:CocE/NonD family hydrolase [Terracidiphilus sp.]
MKRIAAISFVATMLMGAVALAAQTAPAPQPALLIERGVAMKTRDGVVLRADVYRPAGDGPFPVLLQRTPYDKNNTADFALMAVARGYMVVVQDVRGRYTSDGEWYTFKHESDDGYDTVEWAAALPHSNGKVGMFGGSYVGATQMLAAISHPPHLAGICPVVTASNYHENWTYQGGAFEQWFNESWSSGLAQDTVNRTIRAATNARQAERLLPLKKFPVFNLGNISGGPALTQSLAPYYLDWLAHPTYDGYWKQWAIEENYAQIQVPALTVAAWYDIFLGGSLKNYIGLRDHAGNEAVRKQQRLLVTIGGHAGVGRKIGAIDFGPAATEFDEGRITLDWYDYLLKGEQNQFAQDDKPVRLFVMGDNAWRDEAAWPLEHAKATKYYLHSGSKANTLAGDGKLTTDAPKTEAVDTYVYNPANPVPTVGGPLCCDGAHLAPGPLDQNEVEVRPDVLVYATPPLESDMEVTGPVTLDLFAKSSAVDTDFTAKLVDVSPEGFAQNLTEGILRARFRESMTTPKLLEPGKVVELKVDLWATSNVFKKGHRIRLEVSSSNFPRFDRNLNTGRSAADEAKFVSATNTVLHDTDHPSALVLPVVSR